MEEAVVAGLDELTLLESLADQDWTPTLEANAEGGASTALEARLNTELNEIELSNVRALLKTEDQLDSVLQEMDRALDELEGMDRWLESLRSRLLKMGHGVGQIRSQNKGLQIQARNQRALLGELEELLAALDLPEGYLRLLREESLESPAGVQNVEEAAARLQKMLHGKLDPEVRQMTAVTERLSFYLQHSSNFAQRVANYLKVMFAYQADLIQTELAKGADKLKLKLGDRDATEKYFATYRGLILWMREMDARNYAELQLEYGKAFGKVNKAEIKQLFDVIQRAYVPKKPQEEFDYVFYNYKPNANAQPPNSATSLDVVIAKALSSIFERIIHEQNFFCDCFHIGVMYDFQRWKKAKVRPDFKELDTLREPFKDMKVRKRLTEIMSSLFDNLQNGLMSLCDIGVKFDNTNAIAMISAIDRWMITCEGSNQEFLVQILNHLSKALASWFEKFVDQQIQAIEEFTVQGKKKAGVLPPTRVFPTSIGNSVTPVRKVVDTAYARIVKAVFACAEKVSREIEDDKEQAMMHVVMIENMHHFYVENRGIKAPSLEPFIKYAKSCYDSHLAAYLRGMVHRPFGGLLDFFNGVEALLKANNRPEEVAFHPQYNKNTLKKVITQHSARDVRKGLEQLYKRVEKHFSEEEGLLQVIWRGMQEDVLNRVQRFNELIQKCYGGALQLEFTVQDLLGYFSELAKNH